MIQFYLVERRCPGATLVGTELRLKNGSTILQGTSMMPLWYAHDPFTLCHSSYMHSCK
jgi:hypothetical protein